MHIKRSTLIPLILLAYLAVMSWIGYDGYERGEFSALYYFGIIAGTLVVIVLLHFHLRKREQLRRQREDDLKNQP